MPLEGLTIYCVDTLRMGSPWQRPARGPFHRALLFTSKEVTAQNIRRKSEVTVWT